MSMNYKYVDLFLDLSLMSILCGFFLFSFHDCLIDRILLCGQDEPRTHAASTSLQAELQVHITTTVLISTY